MHTDTEKKLLAYIMENKDVSDLLMYYPSYFGFEDDPDRYRSYFLTSPRAAYLYAKDIDKKPTPETREAVKKDGWFLSIYLLEVEKLDQDSIFTILLKEGFRICDAYKWCDTLNLVKSVSTSVKEHMKETS